MNTKQTLIALAGLIVILVGLSLVIPMSTPGGEEPLDTGSQGKLNIQAVCESALAYMTFPDGEAAAQFVAECVQGEHPEVVDRYINDMGLDGAAI